MARTRLDAHSPTDLIPGAGLGVAGLTVSIVTVRRAEAGGGR